MNISTSNFSVMEYCFCIPIILILIQCIFQHYVFTSYYYKISNIYYTDNIVNCGPLLLPLNGYAIINSNDTLEGSSTTFVCLTALTAVVYTSICNQTGDWEPLPTDICQFGIIISCFLYPTLYYFNT